MSKLLEQLTPLDRARFENYVGTYGCTSENFIGTDEYLSSWAKNKSKLFHLLNGNLMVSVPFEYEKDESEIRIDCADKLFSHPFFTVFRHTVREHLYFEKHYFNWDQADAFCISENFAKNIWSYAMKFPNTKGGTTQLQKNMKMIRAINKVIESDPELFEKEYQEMVNAKHKYLTPFQESYNGRTFKQLHEDFVNLHSYILNDKKIKCTLTISIHPLDFITMSDNNKNWTSCMSWQDDGCYHQGTVEMLNSNCVLCCYLHDPKDIFCFGEKDSKTGEREFANEIEWQWNNKRYRQLVYITKDIIMAGKSYPYRNDAIAKKIITEVKKLAMENMNWNYTFGPERYQDMKWINGTKSMERVKGFARMHETKKHNIIFESNAMYNDMVRDSETHYWCYRNKVTHTKVVNVSGPAKCLCCNDTLTHFTDDWDYFERFRDADSVICWKCKKDMTCSYCSRILVGKTITMFSSLKPDKEKRICKCCAEYSFFTCHCCGQVFKCSDSDYRNGVVLLFPTYNKDMTKDSLFSSCSDNWEWAQNRNDLGTQGTFIPVCCDCKEKGLEEDTIEKFDIPSYWGYHRDFYFFKEPQEFTEEDFKAYMEKMRKRYIEGATFIDI